MPELKPGKYQHYKNNKFYKFIGVGLDSKTLEEVVIYQALYNDEEFGDQTLWIRPKEEFMGNVTIDGQEKPRFKPVE